MIIDAHAHVQPTKEPLPKKYEKAALAYKLETGVDVTHFGTANDLLEGMKKNSIERACLFPVATSTNAAQTQKLNNFISALMLEHSSLDGFASVNPNAKNASEELDRAVRELKLRGLKLDPNLQRFHFSDDELWRLLETAKNLKVPVAVHSGFSQGVRETYFDPEEANEMVLSFPRLTFIFTHMGRYKSKGDSPVVYPEPNVFYDTSHAPVQVIQKAVEAYGADKIIFGSDFKYNFYPEYELKKILELHISPRDKEKILGENMAKILGIPLPEKKEQPAEKIAKPLQKVSGLLGKLPFFKR